MNIRTLTVSHSRRYNLGNYRSAELSTMIVVDLDSSEDDPFEVQESAFLQCRAAIQKEAEELGYISSTPPVNKAEYYMGKKRPDAPEFNLDENPY